MDPSDRADIEKAMDALENLLRVAEQQPHNLEVLRSVNQCTVRCMRASAGIPMVNVREMSDDELMRDRDEVIMVARILIEAWRKVLADDESKTHREKDRDGAARKKWWQFWK